MNKEEVWQLIERMESVLNEEGYLCARNISQKDVVLMKKYEDWGLLGNIFTLFNGRAVNVLIEEQSNQSGGFRLKVRFNIPEIEKHFSESFRSELTQGVDEVPEEFSKRFKTKIRQLQLELLYEKRENYQIESLVVAVDRRLGRQKENTVRNEVVHKLMETFGVNTEKELEIKLLTVKAEFLPKKGKKSILIGFSKRLTPNEFLYIFELPWIME